MAAERTGSSKQLVGATRSALIYIEPDSKSMEIPVISWLLDEALPHPLCLSPSRLRILQPPAATYW